LVWDCKGKEAKPRRKKSSKKSCCRD
jgi:hypothetical protein